MNHKISLVSKLSNYIILQYVKVRVYQRKFYGTHIFLLHFSWLKKLQKRALWVDKNFATVDKALLYDTATLYTFIHFIGYITAISNGSNVTKHALESCGESSLDVSACNTIIFDLARLLNLKFFLFQRPWCVLSSRTRKTENKPLYTFYGLWFTPTVLC